MNKVTVPMPPSVNAMYVNVYRKGRVKNGKYRDWQKLCHPMIAEMGVVDGEVFIEYLFNLGTSFRGDLSNHIKAPEDALVETKVLAGDTHKTIKGFSVTCNYLKQKESSLTITVHPLSLEPAE